MRWGLIILLSIYFNGVFAQENNAVDCNKLGDFLNQIDYSNQPAEAIAVVLEHLPELERHQCWELYCYCYNVLSAAYYYSKDYKRAKETAEEGVDLSLKHLGKGITYAAAIGNLSTFKSADQSIVLQLESLEIEKKMGYDDASLAIAIEGLGITYQEIGDYDTAIQYFKQAIDQVKLKDKYKVSRLSRQIADCYLAKGAFQLANEYLKDCIDILNVLPDHNFYKQTRWYAYKNLAEINLKQHKIKEAKFYIEKTLELQAENAMHESYKSWLIAGDIAFYEKDMEAALAYYDNSVAEARKEFELYFYHESFAETVLAKGNVYAKIGDHETALKVYSRALSSIALNFKASNILGNPVIKAITSPLIAFDILNDKTKSLYQMYQKTKEKKYLEAAHLSHELAVLLTRQIRIDYLAQGSKHTLLEKVNPIYEQAIATALELYEISGDEKFLEDAFMFAENNKSVLLYETIKNKSAKTFVGIPDSLIEKEKNLRLEIGFYKEQLLELQQRKLLGTLQTILDLDRVIYQLEADYQQHNQLLEKKYPAYRKRRQQIEPIPVPVLKDRLLNSKTAIVEFVIGEEQSFLFVLTKEKLFALPFNQTSTVEKDIMALHQIISVPPGSNEQFQIDHTNFSNYANRLYQELFSDKVLEALKGIDQLVIIPDGVLSYLPFEILLTEKQAAQNYSYKSLPYLFKKYKISYGYSASLIANEIQESLVNREPTLISFAPSFGAQKYSSARTCLEGNLNALFCNKEEVQSISTFWQSESFVDASATRATFLEASENFDIIHLATHACINEDVAELNKIYFSNNESLTQGALNNLDLKAQLTVLSACNTGSGVYLKGEGVMSLSRSFFLAGSKSVLTSLWPVDDCATAQIMKNYYQELHNGKSKEKAITSAKLKYLTLADSNNSHPYYWASFVQFGNTDPLIKENNPKILPWLIGVVVFLLTFYLYKRRSKTI